MLHQKWQYEFLEQKDLTWVAKKRKWQLFKSCFLLLNSFLVRWRDHTAQRRISRSAGERCSSSAGVPLPVKTHLWTFTLVLHGEAPHLLQVCFYTTPTLPCLVYIFFSLPSTPNFLSLGFICALLYPVFHHHWNTCLGMGVNVLCKGNSQEPMDFLT